MLETLKLEYRFYIECRILFLQIDNICGPKGDLRGSNSHHMMLDSRTSRLNVRQCLLLHQALYVLFSLLLINLLNGCSQHFTLRILERMDLNKNHLILQSWIDTFYKASSMSIPRLNFDPKIQIFCRQNSKNAIQLLHRFQSSKFRKILHSVFESLMQGR